MAVRKSLRVLLWIASGALLATGCGGGKQGIDYGWGEEDDVLGEETWEEVAPDALRLTIVSPAPGVDRIVSGALDVQVRLEDPQDLPATLSFAFSKGIGSPVVRTMEGPGEATVTLDTREMTADGKSRRLVVTAESDDGRTVSANLTMTVDNEAPTIAAQDPTPLSGGNFMGDLVVRFLVQDPGTGVTQVIVRVEDFQYLWPPTGTSAGQAKVDTGEILIPTRGWDSGPKNLTVEATDGMQDHVTTMRIDLGFVRGPQFLAGDVRTLPDGFQAKVLAGVRLGPIQDGAWGLVVAGGGGGQIVTRNPQTARLVRRADLLQVGVTGARVRDVDGDGLDDIVLWGPKVAEGQTGALYVFLQADGGMFSPPFELALPYAAVDLAFGDLNDDGVDDFALALDHASQTLGVVLSTAAAEGEPSWGALAAYGGAVRPTNVAIGDFGGNGRPAIVLTRADSGIATVFPIEGAGIPSGGRNTTLYQGENPVPGLSAMKALRFDGDAWLLADRIVASDPTSDQLLVIKRDERGGDPARLILDANRSTGILPDALAPADFDGNGRLDLAVLCKGGNLVQTFIGIVGGLASGPSFAVGMAQDMTSADLDGDGSRDIVLLDADGMRVTWVRYDPEVGGFEAAPMALLGFVPRSLALGRFTRSIPGRESLLDAAVMGQAPDGKFNVIVRAADPTSGVPMLDTSPAYEIPLAAPVGLIAANVNRTTTSDGGPDDLLVTSTLTAPFNESRPPTAQVMLFDRDSSNHTVVVANFEDLFVGDRPRLMAIADLDRAKPGESSINPFYSVVDLAVLEERQVGTERFTRLQPYIGQGTGQFIESFRQGPTIDSLRNVQQVVPALVRRSLSDSLNGVAKDYDLITVNAGTGDFTVFINGRLAAFTAAQSKDFAVGASPKAIAVGFLENRIRRPAAGQGMEENATEILPDVVTLLANDVVVSYAFDNADAVSRNWSLLDYEPPVSLGHQGRAAVAVALADMNGDDFLDILVLNQADATVSIYVNLANRRFSTPFDFPVGVGSSEMAVADVNGDGCPDLVTADQGGKTLTILRNTVACTPL